MSAPLDIAGILDRAGADPGASEGSQAWALAQVSVAVLELRAAAAPVCSALNTARIIMRDKESRDHAGALCLRLSGAIARLGDAS